MGPGSCTAATASSRRVQRAITRPDRSSRGLFMRVRRRSGQLYRRQRHHCVATNPPQHRTIACTRDTYRSLQTFSTLLESRNLQSTLVEVLVQGKLFPEVGKAGKVGSTASTVFYMPDAVQNSWQYTDRLPNSKKSGDCAKPPKSLEFVPNRDSVWESNIIVPIDFLCEYEYTLQ